MTAPSSQWNASEVLGIDPHSLGFTCVGHAKTQGRRCRNVIAKDNRGEAARILQTMGERNVETADFDDSLESLATCLLCRRWHVRDEHQISSKIAQWRRAIETFRATENARRMPAPAAEMSASATTIVPQTTTPCLIDTLESLRREIVALNERYANALQLASSEVSSSSPQPPRPLNAGQTSSQTRQTSPVEDRNTREEPAAPSRSAPAESGVAPPMTTQNLSEEEQSQDIHPRTSTPEARRPSPNPVHGLPVDGVPPTTRMEGVARSLNVIQHPIEGDCPICCEDLTHGIEISWCQGQCGQNFHADCVGLWLATREDDYRPQTCPNW